MLVIHQRARRLVEVLRERLPDEHLVGVERLDQVADALREHAPEVVFCIKSAAFVGPEFTALVSHPGVAWVHVGGSGVEHLGGWDPRRTTVTNSAGTLAPYLAESWIGALIALEGGLLEAARQQAAGRWCRRPFRSLRGQRLLLVGLGQVGQHVAARAAEAGMRVEAIRAHPERGGADAVRGPGELDARLGEADVVSLHLRLTEATRGLFDAARLARIKPGALFVNTARGGLVDEAALIERLRSGALRGAWLDVFEREPLPTGSPLWSMPNVLITPHAADQVEGWDLLFADRFATLVGAYRVGDDLPALTP